LFGYSFADWQVTRDVAKILVGRLEMDRHGVMDQGMDAALCEMSLQRIAMRVTDDVLVVDVLNVRGTNRPDDIEP
jgi:hypothetical protein